MKRDKKEMAEIKDFLENEKLIYTSFKKNVVVYNEKEDCFEIKFNYKFEPGSIFSYKDARDMWIEKKDWRKLKMQNVKSEGGK